MRTDESLGPCVKACGRSAHVVSTLECRACYLARKRRGGPPVVIEGYAERLANRREASKPAREKYIPTGLHVPLSDGGLSTHSRDLIEEAKAAFLIDSHYSEDMAKAGALFLMRSDVQRQRYT